MKKKGYDEAIVVRLEIEQNEGQNSKRKHVKAGFWFIQCVHLDVINTGGYRSHVGWNKTRCSIEYVMLSEL